ncbi:hypothetical protein I6F50_17375 [Pseudoalteromonas sp. NZS127_1]|uniref:hypothetical protein n=1 Tax=Pseudoalteromonas TaxID=53246 RepID=UPI0018CE52E3|nr:MULTISPECIES: hypothetical protein [Pseudoalteromonas]MBG9996823.1 hypothetical protein [Pseudoalteromonas sp. NZS127_1]MBZ2194485.1 hypothetical protein [Pseudoalteromonas arctica]
MFGLFNKKPKYWALEDSYEGGKEANFIGSTKGCINTVKISRNKFSGNAMVLISFDELQVQPDEVAISITLSKREIGRNTISKNHSGNFIVVSIDSKDSAKLADNKGITVTFIKESTVITSDWVPTKGHRIDICKAVTYS